MGNLDIALEVKIDWLSFTVQGAYTVDEVIEFMGFDLANFREMPSGANGYKRMKKHENISVLYDGAENMGIHVNVTGSSIATLLETYKNSISEVTPFGYKAFELQSWNDTILSLFLTKLLKIARITRLDLAIDDIGVKYYTLDEIEKKQEKQQIVSKWRSCKTLRENTIADNVKIGHTLYFGSTQSEIQLRIYDKQLEQNKGILDDTTNLIVTPWVRWELELHDDRANQCAKLLANNSIIGDVAFGILSHYFRIIKHDDSNKSRCSSETKWDKFIGNVKRLKLTVKKEEKTLDEEQKQWEHQNGRKVAKMFAKNGGDGDYFVDLAYRFEDKLTPRDKEQLGWID